MNAATAIGIIVPAAHMHGITPTDAHPEINAPRNPKMTAAMHPALIAHQARMMKTAHLGYDNSVPQHGHAFGSKPVGMLLSRSLSVAYL